MKGEGNRIDIFGVPLDKLSYEQACRRVEVLLETKDAKIITTPNAEIIMQAQENAELKAALANSDLNFPDGIGVVIASRILGDRLKNRTTGFDLVISLLEKSNDHKRSLYLLGGKPNVAELAAVNIKVKYPHISIAGTHHGYFTEAEEEDIVKEISRVKPHILLVALGAPKQEIFMNEYRDRLQCGVMMGVGGSLDVISGRVRRAPALWQNTGLEWLYRLIKEPRRLKRVMALPLFLWKVIMTKLASTFKMG